jgi:hypothetical protein
LNITVKGRCKVLWKLATATVSYCGTVATLAATNANISAQLETSQAYIKNLKEDIVDIKVKMKPAWQQGRPTGVDTYQIPKTRGHPLLYVNSSPRWTSPRKKTVE